MLLPNDIHAEQSILGSMILSPWAADQGLALLAASDLYRPEHQRIFSAIASISARGEGVDMVTVRSEISKERGADEMLVPYLADLTSASVSRGNIASQAKIVAEHAARRRLIQASHHLTGEALNLETSLADLSALAESSILDATFAQRGGDSHELFAKVLPRVLEEMDQRGKVSKGIPNLPSGISTWDSMTLGLKKQNLYVFAGRPGMGKTASATSITSSVAMRGNRVAFFSLEMSTEEIVERLLSGMCFISLENIQLGRLSPHEQKSLLAARKVLDSCQIAIDDTPGLSVAQILSRARRIRSDMGGLDLVIVDYIGLVKHSAERKAGTRAEELGEIAKGFKAAAKMLDVPVIVLSQINRGVEKRESKRPELSDLKESGGIEENADVVTGLYRPCYYQASQAESSVVEPAEWIVLKGRNVKTGVAKVAFHGPFTHYDNAPLGDGNDF